MILYTYFCRIQNKNFSEEKKNNSLPQTPPFFNSMKQTPSTFEISSASSPGHFTHRPLPAMGNGYPSLRETSDQFLAVISVRRWKLILERLRLTNSCEPKVLSVEEVFKKNGVDCWKEICIWDMLTISSCWWVDDCWVAWYQYVLPNQIWKWWFRNVCLYEHTNSIYVCMMYMYLKRDSYSTHTSQIPFPEKLQITSENNRWRSLETPKGLHCPISFLEITSKHQNLEQEIVQRPGEEFKRRGVK